MTDTPIRYWKTPTNEYLAEFHRQSFTKSFVTPDNEFIDSGFDYLLRSQSGMVLRIFAGSEYAAQEVYGISAYIVVRNALYNWVCEWIDLEPADPAREYSVIEGLVPVRNSDLPFDPSIADALAEYERTEQEKRRRSDEAAWKICQARGVRRPLTSPTELPDLIYLEKFDVSVECVQESDIVVRAGDEEIWRELVSASGRERPRELEELLKAKYGGRMTSFASTIDYDFLYGT